MSETRDEELTRRVAREHKNAVDVARIAREDLSSAGKLRRYDLDNHGDIDVFVQIQNIRIQNTASLQSIVNTTFQAMMEVETETENDRNIDLWYANQNTSVNHVLGVSVLSWTHPEVQVSMSARLGKSSKQLFVGLTLSEMLPIARAKFDEVRPEISGIYEPGGQVNPQSKIRPKLG